ncbi:CaiB/BaiF CoA-transferase family protein [Reyranella sp.]|uniref:CaiB/BaiF CoA transferase family protein n=1 Tax=Reyranella sp. TaxID=1929291 RepID=UPI0011F5B88E|nr:CoA transferase [Reyranella sp.]TAJ82093.1 MAG: CoA transferase [Reyranella sp.]
MSIPKKALGHVRVLDMSQFTPGPLCAQILGDLGAEVIKIERPNGNDDRRATPLVRGFGVYYALNNRDKKTVTLNLKQAKGADLLRQLVGRADILIENYRPGFLAQLGLGYDDLRKANPKLIMISVTGFGQTGPYKDRGGFDMIAQAVGGLMSLNGDADDPPLKAGTSTAAMVTGLNAAIGALAALQHRDRTGEGQWIDVALLDSAVSQIEADLPYFGLTGDVLPRVGNRRLYSAPANVFKATDGFVYIAPGVDAIWKRLCRVIGRADLADHPDYLTNEARIRRVEDVERVVQEWVTPRNKDEVVALLVEAEVPCGVVNDVREVLDDPQVGARQMVVTASHPTMGDMPVPGQPLKMSGTPLKSGRMVFDPGQHNSEVYGELLNLTLDELQSLQKAGVI